MGDLRDAFDDSAEASSVLTAADAALVEAGRKIADRIDEAIATGEGQEVTKALYLVPHLVNILREMLATPAIRVKLGAKKEAPSGKLGGLRAVPRPKTA